MTTYGNEAGQDDLGAVEIKFLFVECSFQLRNIGAPGFAASDCCRAPADTAVEMEDAGLHWRCPDHRGLRRSGVSGRVVKYITKRTS